MATPRKNGSNIVKRYGFQNARPPPLVAHNRTSAYAWCVANAWGPWLEKVGVPPSGTDARAQFNVSFWASFWSGVFYSIFTGLFVGLAVWAVQLLAEQRRQRATYAKELAAFKEKLRPAVRQPVMAIVDADPMNTEPAPVALVAELARQHPVDTWAQSLSREREFFEPLRAVRREHLEFVETAGALKSALVRYYRNLNDSRGLIAANDVSNVAFFMGRLQGADAASVKPWVPSGALPGLEVDYQTALQQTNIADIAERYRACRNRMMAAVALVSGTLEH